MWLWSYCLRYSDKGSVMKTPEEMAEEFFENWQPEKPKYIRPKARQYALEKVTECFLAGYQAGKDNYKDAISAYEDVAKLMLEEAVRIMSPKDQLGDAGKVICNTPLKEILAVDTCEPILDMEKMVDVNSSSGWISVKEQLPEQDVAVLTCGQVFNNFPEVIGVGRRYNGDQEWKHTWECEDGFIYQEDAITHWMPLPKPPEEK